MNVLEAAAQCPKCAKLCICAGGHVRHDSLPCFLTACLLACFLPVNAQNTNTLTSTLPSKQQVKCHAGLQRLRRQQNASERTDRRQKRLQVQKVHVKKDHNKKSFRQRLRLAAGTTGSSAETSQKREAEPDEGSVGGVGVGGVGKLNPVVSPPNHVGVSLPKSENLNFEELLSLLLAGIVPPQASQRNAELLPMFSTNNPGLRGPMGNGVYLSGTILPTLQDGGANALLALSAIIASAEAVGRYGAINDLQQVLNAIQAANGGSI